MDTQIVIQLAILVLTILAAVSIPISIIVTLRRRTAANDVRQNMNPVTPYPTIDDLRTRNQVLELANHASQEEWRMIVRQLSEQIKEAGLEPVIKPNGRLKAAAEGNDPIVRIYDLLVGYFSNGDIEELRFVLGVPEGEISGAEKPQRIIKLVEYCKNHGRLNELVKLCQSKRRHLDWPTVGLDS